MDMLGNVVIFLVTIILLVLIHEAGHFCVARILGVTVERFSIGFGRALCKFKSRKSGVEYVLAPILLGGYVKLNDDSYNAKPAWRRLLIMLAGVAANLLLAILVFWLLFSIGIKGPKPVIGEVVPHSIAAEAGLYSGMLLRTIDNKPVASWQEAAIAIVKRLGDKNTMTINGHVLALQNWSVSKLDPDPIAGLGFKPYTPFIRPIVNEVKKNSPASRIGLRRGDRVISVDKTPIKRWQQFLRYIAQHPQTQVDIVVTRGHHTIKLSGKTGSRFQAGWKSKGYLGVSSLPVKWPSNMLQERNYGIFGGLIQSLRQTWMLFSFNFIVLAKLAMGKISLKVLGGPITIFAATEQAFQHGIIAYISFLAMLSIMLAFINILPIPVLDGGNAVMLVIEMIFKKPIPENVQLIAVRIGLFILAAIMFVAIGNDVLRILS
ncbi:MAG: RIP metalloprotease RseP [Gammaproteobacteria bacterium]|nr:RIP metalloprotease RseP [Gammaproteobacteria bacterium]